jgi:hypothetical protein
LTAVVQSTVSVDWHNVPILVERLRRIAEKIHKAEDMTLDLSAPFVFGSNAFFLAAATFQSSKVPSSDLSPHSSMEGSTRCLSTLLASAYNTLTQYDFPKEIGSDAIAAILGNTKHGVLNNAPSRAVKSYD